MMPRPKKAGKDMPKPSPTKKGEMMPSHGKGCSGGKKK